MKLIAFEHWCLKFQSDWTSSGAVLTGEGFFDHTYCLMNGRILSVLFDCSALGINWNELRYIWEDDFYSFECLKV